MSTRSKTDEGAADGAELLNRACRALARRDRSRAEMKAYLERQGAGDDTVTELLDELQRRGYMSDARLADQVIRTRARRGSALRVRQEMARRGIEDEVIESSTAGLDAADLQVALALWQRRFGNVPSDRRQREAQLRFLRNRGFSHAVALKVLRTAGAADDDA